MRYLNRLVALFPVWAILGTTLALLRPGLFSPLAFWIVPLLGLVMFGMGLTLRGRDFLEVARRPALIAAGSALQFGVMPLAAWVVGHLLGLSPELLTGLVLVGSCPGGTASNVITYLARGDVALSIALTSVSTFLSVFATPALTWLYVGELVPVPIVPMLRSILTIVIVPVVAGVLVNHFLGAKLAPLRDVFPLVSVASIVLIVSIIVALEAAHVSELAGAVVLAVMLHNGVGLGAGYWLPRLFGLDERICRTLAIEVGMQNSGLGVALATQFFSAAAALPGAVFSVWHNLSGSILAGWWTRRAAE